VHSLGFEFLLAIFFLSFVFSICLMIEEIRIGDKNAGFKWAAVSAVTLVVGLMFYFIVENYSKILL
jgi:predicted membrane channel-forming protein YqfA (hemolysin III family)